MTIVPIIPSLYLERHRETVYRPTVAVAHTGSKRKKERESFSCLAGKDPFTNRRT